jgi:tRNA(fMet)-specific endonuclease VapC
MILHVLDTDHISLFQRKHPTVVQNMVSADPNQLAVSIVTVEEQITGHFKLIKQANSGAKLIRAYAALQSGVAYFNTITVLPFDEVANTYYETLRKQKIRIGSQDLRIAAIVLSVKGILVTRNRKDFAKVPDLTLEDWSIS